MDFVLNESRLVYLSKINEVQDFIEAHLDEELGITQLARVASFSEFHFQRIFRLMTGESLYAFIKRLRLEKAVFYLRSNQKMQIQDIALAVGFSTQASLAKAIKDRYGLTSSEIRKMDDIGMNRNEVRTNGKVFNHKIQYNTPCELLLQTLDPIEVLYLRHTGAYKGDSDLFMKLFSRLYGHASRCNLMDSSSRWFTVYHDLSELTEEEKLRFSVCLSVNKAIKSQGEFGRMEIAGGRYAVGRFLLGTEDYQGAWNYMMTKWLPESGYMPDDRLCFEHYPPQESHEDQEENTRRMVEIFIPIAPL